MAKKEKNKNNSEIIQKYFIVNSDELSNEIIVKNAEGYPDTKARVLIKNKIDYIPKVSVIIPVYNTEKYLRECLDSVINQTLKEIEIICVDDGSTDNSLEILKEYAAKDNRITVLNQENLYAGVARNAGMMVASGEYYHFLDSDDWVEDIIYSKLLNTNYDVLIFKYNNFDVNLNTTTSTTGIFDRTINIVKKVNPKDYKDRLFQLSNPMPWNKIIKSNIAKQVKFQNIRASNDIFFSFMSMAISNSILLVDSALVYYRYNRRESLKNTRDKSPKDFLQAYKYLKLRLEKLFIYDKFAKSYYQSLISSSMWTIDNVKENKESIKLFIKDNILHEIDFSLVDDNLRNIFLFKLNNKIIVSLTSFPARINFVHIAIKSILQQSVKPDKVILWLAPEQFNGKENDLPKELLNLKNEGLEIDWYHDIKSYKKLIPTLKKYPDDIIITIDDDLIYDNNLIKNLIQSYDGKNIISSRLTRLIINNNELCVADRNIYETHKTESMISFLKTPSFLNSLNSGSGCLYPPKCFNGTDILNEKVFMELASTCDDLWFWVQALRNNIKVKYPIHPNPFLNYIENSQKIALWRINNANDRKLFYEILNKLVKYYNIDLSQCEQESLKFIDCMLGLVHTHILNNINYSRIDIKNNGLKNNKIEIIQIANNSKAISTYKSNGYSFIGNNNIIEFKAIRNGLLVIDLFGIENGITYNQIKLNDENILENSIVLYVNDAYKIKKNVTNNKVYKLEIDYADNKVFKINIRNVKTPKNNIELLNNSSKINVSTPAWFTNDKGIGSVLISQNYKDSFKVKAIGNGNLSFKFMGIDKRFNNEKIPLYVNYQSIKINGKEILDEPITAWHDKAFVYEMKVKDSEIIDVEVIKSPYPYTKNELKDLIIKLSNGVEPKDINNIIKHIIKNRLEYEKSTKTKQPSKIFSITREKYKTIYYLLGLKYVKFNTRQEILDLIKEENAKLKKEIEQLKIELKNK